MLKSLSKVLGGLFILLIAFSDAIYFMVMGALGLGRNQSLFHGYHIVLAVFGLIYFLNNIQRIPIKTTIGAFIMMSIVIVLYYCTRFFYGYVDSHYSVLFTALFPRFCACIIVGISMLGDRFVLEKVESALPVFVVLFTVLLSRYVLSIQVDVNLSSTFESDAGLTYQSLSYFSIYMYGFALYLVTESRLSRFWKMAFLGMGMICIIICIITGGRGAFVLAVVFTLYFFRKRLSWGGVIIALTFFTGLYLLFSVMQSNELFGQGASRLLDFFGSREAMENDVRWERWGIAWRSFQTSKLIGHGLGSVFYEVGQYSHNIFTDMLCEGGLLLVGLFVANLSRFISNYRRIVKNNYRIKIIFVCFLCAFVLLCFSGYYLSQEALWISLAYVLPQSGISR